MAVVARFAATIELLGRVRVPDDNVNPLEAVNNPPTVPAPVTLSVLEKVPVVPPTAPLFNVTPPAVTFVATLYPVMVSTERVGLLIVAELIVGLVRVLFVSV
jgi:hypothetical protein